MCEKPVTVVTAVTHTSLTATGHLLAYGLARDLDDPLRLAVDTGQCVGTSLAGETQPGALQSGPERARFDAERDTTPLCKSRRGGVGGLFVEVEVGVVRPADELRALLRVDALFVLGFVRLPAHLLEVGWFLAGLAVPGVDSPSVEETPEYLEEPGDGVPALGGFRVSSGRF